MTRLLSLFGLMRVSEHEREIAKWEAGATRWQDKLKLAVADLEKQSVELNEWKTLANDLGAIVEATKDDALAMRRKRQRDRDRRKGNG